MNLYTYFKTHPNEVESAINYMAERETHVYTGEPYTKEEQDDFRLALTHLVRDFAGMTPNQESSDSVILFIRRYDALDDEMELLTESNVFRKEDLMNYPVSKEILGLDAHAMSTEEINALFEKMKALPFITSYGYEFSPWEDWLGLDIDEDSLNACGTDEGLTDVLREMTFNGFTRESQDERRAELEESASHFDELMAMDEEERKEHLISWEEVKKDLGFEDTRTPEEKQRDTDNMTFSAVHFFIEKQNTIDRYQKAHQTA